MNIIHILIFPIKNHIMSSNLCPNYTLLVDCSENLGLNNILSIYHINFYYIFDFS